MLVSTTYSPLIAALFVWTQWRHFFVLSSVFPILGCGGILLFLPKKIRILGGFVVVSISISLYQQWHPYQQQSFEIALHRENKKISRYRDKIVIADYLRDTVPDGSVVIADDIIAILAKKPPIQLHQKEIYTQKLPQWPNFMYRSYMVSNRRPGIHWESIKSFSGTQNQVFRLKRPQNVEERCLYGFWDGPIVERIPSDLERPQPRNICTDTTDSQ